MHLYTLVDPYALRQDGSKPLTADWDAGPYKLTARQLASDVAIGTAPLIITSTTLVANLNADYWDGYHFASYLDQPVLTSSSPTFVTLTLTDLIVDTNLIKTISATNCVGINKTTPIRSFDVVGDVRIIGPVESTGGYVLEVAGGAGDVCEDGQGTSITAGDGGEGTGSDPSGDGGSIIFTTGDAGADEGGGKGSDGVVRAIGDMRVTGNTQFIYSSDTYEFSQRTGEVLSLQNLATNKNMILELLAKDGDGDDYVGFNIWGYGTIGQETNRELLLVRFNPSDYYEIFSAAAGSGTVRPIKLYTGAHTDQLVLNTDGSVNIGDTTDYVSIGTTGDTKFVGGAGLPFGSCYGNHIGWSQANAAQNTWYNISDADMNDGQLHNVTHDGSGKLTVTNAGMYLVAYGCCFEDNVANDHIEVGVEISNSGSANGAGQGHLENKFANEEEHLSSSCILDLAASATLEVAIRTTDADTPTISVQAVNLTAVQIGGT